MKKGLKKLVTVLLAASCCASAIAFTACGGVEEPPSNVPCVTHVDADNNGKCDVCGEAVAKQPCTTHVDENGDGKCDVCGENMPTTVEDEYEINVTGTMFREIDIDSEDNILAYTVRNNGAVVTGKKVNATVEGESVTYDETTGRITPVKLGETDITLTLEDDPTVTQTITYDVHNYFFSHDAELQRGSISFVAEEAESPYVTVSGGQASVLVKKASTRFMFRCKIATGSAAIANTSSFGVASFVQTPGAPAGDKALWFGLRKQNNKPDDDVFAVYKRAFYEGWSTNVTEGTDAGYGAISVDRGAMDMTIIRDGADYYYSIDGYYGKLTYDKGADVPTFAGVYSQNIGLEISDWQYTRDEQQVAAAVEEFYTSRTVAAIAINEEYMNEAVKGTSFAYTAKAYPADRSEGVELLWDLDKSEMTAGADGTTIENGVLTVAADAKGGEYVTVICKAKDTDIERRVRVEILDRARLEENELLTAFGGVEIDDTSIVFPQRFMSRNGITNSITGGNEGNYEKTMYCAVLKQNVTRNFSLEFAFSDYTTDSAAPKLQISLGANCNNFYLVCRDGRFRMETFTSAARLDGFIRAGWYNSPWQSLDAAARHTVRISVTDGGVYAVTVDGAPLEFKEGEGVGGAVTLMRYYSDYDAELPVKFASYNCAARVSDITVTNGTAQLPEMFAPASKAIKKGDAYEFSAAAASWDINNHDGYWSYFTRGVDSSFALDMTATFSAVMNDGKLLIGTRECNFQLCNKNGVLSVQPYFGGGGKISILSLC